MIQHTTQKHSLLAAMLLSALTLVITSCQAHDPFCFEHPHGAKVRVDVDWTEFKEENTTGMSISLFSSTSTLPCIERTTGVVDYSEFNLLPDEYTMIVHNQSPVEFGTIEFENMSNYPMARVLPTRYTSDENDWYDPIDNETMVLNPEWIAFGKESFTVTQDMVKEENDNYGKPRTNIKDKTLVATLVPQNIIYTLHISVHIRGIDNYKAGRAVITGLADGYFPGREEYSPKQVTHFAEDWSIKEKSINTDGIWEGTITTEITCFGLPMGHAGDSKDNILRLSLLLIDDKTLVNRMFYVGDKFHRKTIDESSLHLYLDLKLSDELPNVAPAQNTGQSGFDATVDEWGEEENSEIIM